MYFGWHSLSLVKCNNFEADVYKENYSTIMEYIQEWSKLSNLGIIARKIFINCNTSELHNTNQYPFFLAVVLLIQGCQGTILLHLNRKTCQTFYAEAGNTGGAQAEPPEAAQALAKTGTPNSPITDRDGSGTEPSRCICTEKTTTFYAYC